MKIGRTGGKSGAECGSTCAGGAFQYRLLRAVVLELFKLLEAAASVRLGTRFSLVGWRQEGCRGGLAFAAFFRAAAGGSSSPTLLQRQGRLEILDLNRIEPGHSFDLLNA